MKGLFKKYKTVVRFVVLFFSTYLLLSLLYSVYLNVFFGGKYFPDFFTHLVAQQSNAVLSGLGYISGLAPSKFDPSMVLTIKNNYNVRIVEGCNSISVIILFISFIIAFAEKFKKTFLFLLAGTVLIYTVNIFRIVFLVIALYKYPQYENILHSVIFPGIIYSMVFMLWMLWVRILKPKTPNA